ncbi:vWA domain-containing protein [Planctomicrobium piriforme]|uniref:N-terminal double-transmembrane domain-containing protein n=1 Tax=Planctomicrobium piriforme TaxID=1576369 RepID=A0A1I3MT93_9PLAN|nr:BatA domain-containing protein [Planctomicrobium piriforme]SFI99926.1 N-terminal double-transmembrane domain-containing protein [Planctomicrobium piriforme]
MSFLAPLYLLAGLAIGLPIAFHMIRRSPQGRQVFSSVMFLTPDPPRMTKRSRIEDWLLLLLRAAAICLLAVAFARPFLRAQDQLPDARAQGRRLAVLLDVSASMRRDECWTQAQQAVQKILNDLNPADSFSLTTFAADEQELITADEWAQLPPESRIQTVKERLAAMTPGWLATATGKALISTAERLEENDQKGQGKLVILISDMQAGSGWEALNGFSWPEDVSVRLVPVQPPDPSNAALQLVADERRAPGVVRLRVANAPNSTGDAFQIGWRDPFAAAATRTDLPAISVSVTPGQSRVIQSPAGDANQPSGVLLLTGDAAPFDNACYVVTRSVEQLRILYLGDTGKESGPNDLRFFLPPMFPATPYRSVEIIDWKEGNQPPDPEQRGFTWLIIGDEPTAEQAAWIKNWLQQGGSALFVARNAAQASAVYGLLGLPPATVEEADSTNYAMLQKIDFQHSALRQFDDPRYSDFTKLRFWKHRMFPAESLPELKVLAAFDDGSPALAQLSVQQGTLTLLASGWNRDDSDLAVSTKFVPLMNALLDEVAPTTSLRQQKTVGDELLMSEFELKGETAAIQIGNETQTLPIKDRFLIAQPGLYRIAETAEQLATDKAIIVAANLSPEESRTEPFPPDLLTAAGVQLESSESARNGAQQLTPEQQRQLMNHELESRQQWWRWLVVGALAVLFLESVLAAWKGRSREAAVATT